LTQVNPIAIRAAAIRRGVEAGERAIARDVAGNDCRDSVDRRDADGRARGIGRNAAALTSINVAPPGPWERARYYPAWATTW
jgi:hypothetical protein